MSSTDDSSIKFNLDAFQDGDRSRASLSDVYGIQVFTADVGEQISLLEKENQLKNSQIKEQVFFHQDAFDEEMLTIQHQVFTSAAVLTKAEPEPAQSEEDGITILFVEVVILLCLIVGVIYGRKKKKEREEHLENIDHFSDV